MPTDDDSFLLTREEANAIIEEHHQRVTADYEGWRKEHGPGIVFLARRGEEVALAIITPDRMKRLINQASQLRSDVYVKTLEPLMQRDDVVVYVYPANDGFMARALSVRAAPAAAHDPAPPIHTN